MTSTQYLDKTQQRNIERVTRVVRLFSLLLHSKCQKATLITKEAVMLMIQSTIYPWLHVH